MRRHEGAGKSVVEHYLPAVPTSRACHVGPGKQFCRPNRFPVRHQVLPEAGSPSYHWNPRKLSFPRRQPVSTSPPQIGQAVMIVSVSLLPRHSVLFGRGYRDFRSIRGGYFGSAIFP